MFALVALMGAATRADGPLLQPVAVVAPAAGRYRGCPLTVGYRPPPARYEGLVARSPDDSGTPHRRAKRTPDDTELRSDIVALCDSGRGLHTAGDRQDCAPFSRLTSASQRVEPLLLTARCLRRRGRSRGRRLGAHAPGVPAITGWQATAGRSTRQWREGRQRLAPGASARSRPASRSRQVEVDDAAPSASPPGARSRASARASPLTSWRARSARLAAALVAVGDVAVDAARGRRSIASSTSTRTTCRLPALRCVAAPRAAAGRTTSRANAPHRDPLANDVVGRGRRQGRGGPRWSRKHCSSTVGCARVVGGGALLTATVPSTSASSTALRLAAEPEAVVTQLNATSGGTSLDRRHVPGRCSPPGHLASHASRMIPKKIGLPVALDLPVFRWSDVGLRGDPPPRWCSFYAQFGLRELFVPPDRRGVRWPSPGQRALPPGGGGDVVAMATFPAVLALVHVELGVSRSAWCALTAGTDAGTRCWSCSCSRRWRCSRSLSYRVIVANPWCHAPPCRRRTP
jgi:hypothetical protein